MTTKKLFAPRDHAIWHPCSQMKDYEVFPPLRIHHAKGSYLYTEDGRAIIDAISSWWCKPLGHGHPRLREALIKQSERFEHVILAQTTSSLLEKLSEKLLALAPPLTKVFYSGDGSSAIEIALKMSLQYHAQTDGPHKRTQFAHLRHGYHGENLLSLSVSDLGLYKEPFRALCPKNVILPEHRMVQSIEDPHWHEWHLLAADEWDAIEKVLSFAEEKLAGVIIEPVIQGAGGMRPYSPQLIRLLREWTQKRGLHLIADEVMTGLGRTGTALAMNHSGVMADLVILMKGLSAGFLPFSAVLVGDDIYEQFYADWETRRAFIHSNTYSGNALGAAVALEVLNIYAEEDWFGYVTKHSRRLQSVMERVGARTGALKNIRGVGWITAADLAYPEPHAKKIKRAAFQVYQECLRLGALIRPLGETLYLLPPFNIPLASLETLENILCEAIDNVRERALSIAE